MSSGKPMPAACSTKASISSSPVTEGATGTPFSSANRRERILSPIRSIVSGAGPMKDEPGGLDGAGEGAVFGQETVTGMNRLGAGLFGGGDDLIGVEIGGDGRVAGDLGAQVGQPDETGLVFRHVVHRDRLHPEPAAGVDHPGRRFRPGWRSGMRLKGGGAWPMGMNLREILGMRRAGGPARRLGVSVR